MNILIGISSCQAFENSGLNKPIRDTWLPDAYGMSIDVLFFHGAGAVETHNTILLPVEDGMGGLTEKAKAKAKWAFDNSYDFMFSCFPDTYVCPGRLLGSDFQHYDYLGREHQHPGGAPYCQGGPGYFLSRKAMRTLFENTTSYLNDDCWVGDVLNRGDIKRGDSKEFSHLGPGPLRTNSTITNHLSTQPGGYVGTNMYEEHRRWLDSWL